MKHKVGKPTWRKAPRSTWQFGIGWNSNRYPAELQFSFGKWQFVLSFPVTEAERKRRQTHFYKS